MSFTVEFLNIFKKNKDISLNLIKRKKCESGKILLFYDKKLREAI